MNEDWIFCVPDEIDHFGCFPPTETEPTLLRFADRMVMQLSSLDDWIAVRLNSVSSVQFRVGWFLVSCPVIRAVRKRLIQPNQSNFQLLRRKYFWWEDLQREQEREERWYQEHVLTQYEE